MLYYLVSVINSKYRMFFLQTVDHFMAGLEDIIGYHDHHNIREK